MLGNFANSSASVACDTKDSNGESLYAGIAKYSVMLFNDCVLTTILMFNAIKMYGISDPILSVKT
jgi:hypothetical protein